MELTACEISEKVKNVLRDLERIIKGKKTGCLEVNVSQGGVTNWYFKEKLG